MLRKLQEEQRPWVLHNFGNRPSWMPLLGAVEELGELAHAHLKAAQGIRLGENHQEAAKDAVADIVIYLADYCSAEGYDFESIVTETWEKVRLRDWKADPIRGVSAPKNSVQEQKLDEEQSELKTLEDCLSNLIARMPQSELDWFRDLPEDEALAQTHMGLGQLLRNEWGLWTGSKLTEYFNSLEVQHPDDMSGIILTSLHRRLKGEPLRVEEQIQFYKKYWESVERESDRLGYKLDKNYYPKEKTDE